MANLSNMSLDRLIQEKGHVCACGRIHKVGLRFLKIGQGVVNTLPEAITSLGFHKPFVVCDPNTKRVAWDQVRTALEDMQIPYTLFTFGGDVEPDEHAIGSLAMAFDRSCDVIVAVGSGVINDCCKVLAHTLGMPSMVVGTAPSMDGYASNSSSMIQNRVKVSLYNACPIAIIADTAIMAQAPMRMLWAGLGDMLAKYVSICEWRISHLVIDEYYCENIAGLVRSSLKRIVDSVDGLMIRDPDAVGAVVEGLILSGISMAFAQISRPASGLEHYFSHLWEMMALDRNLPYELHGIQVGVGTRLTFALYEHIKTLHPSRDVAKDFIDHFDEPSWEANLQRIFGKAGDTIIQTAKQEGKNDPTLHQQRLDRLIDHWDDLLRIIDEELPSDEQLASLMQRVGMPMHPMDIGINHQDTVDAFIASREIRNKYLTSSMLWDLGLLDEMAKTL